MKDVAGLIVGLIIRVASSREKAESIEVVPKNGTGELHFAPSFVRLLIKTGNESGMFHYKLEDRFLGNNSEEKELMEEKVGQKAYP